MGANGWQRRTQFFEGERREPRWVDRRIAVSKLRGAEYPSMTEDISLGGMRLGVWNADPKAGSEISVEVAFEDRLLGFRGRVRYALPRPWGALVGVQCARKDEPTLLFLAKRYHHWVPDRRIDDGEGLTASPT